MFFSKLGEVRKDRKRKLQQTHQSSKSAKRFFQDDFIPLSSSPENDGLFAEAIENFLDSKFKESLNENSTDKSVKRSINKVLSSESSTKTIDNESKESSLNSFSECSNNEIQSKNESTYKTSNTTSFQTSNNLISNVFPSTFDSRSKQKINSTNSQSIDSSKEYEEIVIDDDEPETTRESISSSEDSIDLNDFKGYNDFNKSNLIHDSSSESSYCEIIDDSNDAEIDINYGCVETYLNLNSQNTKSWHLFDPPSRQFQFKLLNNTNTNLISKTIESCKRWGKKVEQVKDNNLSNQESKKSKKKQPTINQSNYHKSWCQPNKRYLNITGLHNEINDFYEYSKLTPEEIKVRNHLFFTIKDVILEKWPQARIYIFGSHQTNLSLSFSDLDIVVFNSFKRIPFYNLQSSFVKAGITTFEQTKIISKAKVPIIKFIHKETGISVDISFNAPNGPRVVQLIRDFIELHPSFAKLMLVIKMFLHQRALNIPYVGGLSSYSLTLMMMAFYEGYYKQDSLKNENLNLGVLLMEFLEFYGVLFNHRMFFIRISKGVNFVKKSMYANIQKLEKNSTFLCIEDPLCQDKNASQSSHQYDEIKKSFHNAFLRLQVRIRNRTDHKMDNSILGDIIGFTTEQIEQRKRVLEYFSQNFGICKPKGIEFSFDPKSDYIPINDFDDIPDRIIAYDEYD